MTQLFDHDHETGEKGGLHSSLVEFLTDCTEQITTGAKTWDEDFCRFTSYPRDSNGELS